MEYKIRKILEYLQPNGVGTLINISPILRELYPVIEPKDLTRIRQSWSNITSLLNDMKDHQLISFGSVSNAIGGDAITGYTLLNNVAFPASILSEGIKELEDELKKIKEISLQDSMIELNEINKQALTSTMNLNDVVIPRFNRSQRNLTLITIVVATLSLIAIAVSAYFSSKSPTSADIQKLDSTLQKNSKLLDSLVQIQKRH